MYDNGKNCDKLDFDMHSVHDTVCSLHFLVILAQLMRPGIGQNASCAASDMWNKEMWNVNVVTEHHTTKPFLKSTHPRSIVND